MKTQSKITNHSGKTTRPAMRLHASADGQPPPPAPGQAMPTGRSKNEFTIEDHLRVQREIEERAHRFWFAKGCALKSALNDWLKAEDEVLAEFVNARTQRQPVPSASNKTQTQIRATSALPSTTIYQHAAMSKLKLTAAFHSSL